MQSGAQEVYLGLKTPSNGRPHMVDRNDDVSLHAHAQLENYLTLLDPVLSGSRRETKRGCYCNNVRYEFVFVRNNVIQSSSYLILSYSCAVVKIFVSPRRTSQKGRQPLRCLLKQGTGVMVRPLITRGLECGRLGFSDTMLHT